MRGNLVDLGEARHGLLGQQAQKRVLVAGGAGFLGSHICDRMIGMGHIVICVDNLQTGRLENIAHLIGHPSFSFIHHDIVDELFVAGPVDEIFNMACPASPPKYQLDPIKTFKTSVLGVMNLLELSLDKQARFLQASTSEVYGDPEVSPQPESYRGLVNSYGPRACYDEGKRGAETLIYDYTRQRGAQTKIARIFNTYGPRMSPEDGRVVSNFIMQALQNEDITIYGDGTQTRSFCYVNDLVEGLLRLMASSPEQSAPVNLGNPGEFTMLELAQVVMRKTRSKSRLVFRDLPEDDPRQRRPSITRAKEWLGWVPRVSLDQGLDPTIAYFASELGRNAEGAVLVS